MNLLKYHEKARLAIKSMIELNKLYCTNIGFNTRKNTVNAIMENWRTKTCKPLTEAEYYKIVEASVAHLRKDPWLVEIEENQKKKEP